MNKHERLGAQREESWLTLSPSANRSDLLARGTLAALCLAVASCALAPGALAAAEAPEKLHIFGYLTQAYGQSSAGSILGTTEGGTTNLRNFAVQFRWETSERDTVVVQLAHAQRGEGLFFPGSDEVEVDWAFYERRIGDHTAVKVGRLNVPLGIYNEIRDVGTLLPFFDLPIGIYSGVLSSAETVEGVALSHTLASRSRWALETEIYHGGWDTFQQQVDLSSKIGLANLEARAEDGLGLQLWLDTPIDGLRLGVGALSWVLESALGPPGTQDDWDSHHVSLDFTSERWLFRAEKRRWTFEQDFGAFLNLPVSLRGEAQRDGFYAQLGGWVTPKAGLFGQYDEVRLKDSLGLLPGLEDFHTDIAVSFNYRFRPDLLFKVEYHDADTRLPLAISDQPTGVGSDPMNVSWAIASLSVSF